MKDPRQVEGLHAHGMPHHHAQADHRPTGSRLPSALGQGECKSGRDQDCTGKQCQSDQSRIVGGRRTPLIGADRQEVRGPEPGRRCRPRERQPGSARPAMAIAPMTQGVERDQRSGSSNQPGKKQEPQIELNNHQGWYAEHGNLCRYTPADK